MTLEGTQFSHYRLLTLIGKGGMGEVYLAEDTQVRRQVAAKLIKIETVQADQQFVTNSMRLFLREAAAIASLDHPSILPLYDHGETKIEGLHVAYLITPYRPEGSLVIWLHKRAQTQQTWQLTLKQVAHVIQQASQGLQYAHDRAVMHLDVKPANFLIRSRSEADEYPDLLLSDFGIARLASATSSTSQHLSGTPIYMAPEQCLGQPTFASDQYALAIMAYELLTGRPPFQGSPMSVMFAHVQEQPEPVHERNPLLPSAVDLVLQRGLAKKPEERFPSVAAFAQVFEQASLDVPEESILRPSPPAPPTLNASVVHLPVATEPVADVDQDEHMPTKPAETLPPLLHPISADQPARRKRWVRALATICIVASLLASGLVGVSAYQRHVYSVNTISTATAQARANPTSTAQAIASTLGQTWYAHYSGTPVTLYQVAWSGSQFVIVGDKGHILTSPNGSVWTARHSGTSASLWGGVAWSGSQFVALGDATTADSSTESLTSPNGSTWIIQNLGSTIFFTSIARFGSRLLATGEESGSNVIFTSSDGRTWTTLYSGSMFEGALENITWSGSEYVAVGGVNETLQSNEVVSRNVILSSPDGRTWTTQHSGTEGYLWSVTWSGSRFVAVGGSYGGTGTILTSPDGRTWTVQHSGVSAELHGVAWSGSRFVVVGDHGTILTSPDGRTWTVQHSGVLAYLADVAWLDSQFVVVGQSGTILTSR